MTVTVRGNPESRAPGPARAGAGSHGGGSLGRPRAGLSRLFSGPAPPAAGPGRAVLNCSLRDSGWQSRCQPASVMPAGWPGARRRPTGGLGRTGRGRGNLNLKESLQLGKPEPRAGPHSKPEPPQAAELLVSPTRSPGRVEARPTGPAAVFQVTAGGPGIDNLTSDDPSPSRRGQVHRLAGPPARRARARHSLRAAQAPAPIRSLEPEMRVGHWHRDRTVLSDSESPWQASGWNWRHWQVEPWSHDHRVVHG